jgi:hypothetical protein
MSFLPFLDIGIKLIDKLIPDPQAKAQAQIDLLKLQQSGEFKELEERMGAIKTEAASADPWTSRARPSFMYVMYVMILSSLPAGMFFISYPAETNAFITGMQMFLKGIPEQMWYLFGAGYLGYTHYRTKEKIEK